jgi:O-succinylbenzoate synthase
MWFRWWLLPCKKKKVMSNIYGVTTLLLNQRIRFWNIDCRIRETAFESFKTETGIGFVQKELWDEKILENKFCNQQNLK